MWNRWGVHRVCRVLLWIEGLYFLAMGLWPLLMVSGYLQAMSPRQDWWHAQTAGALGAILGATMCAGGMRPFVREEACVPAVAGAAAMLALDVTFSALRVVSPVYLVDGGIQLGFLVAWVTVGLLALKARQAESSGPRRHHLATAWR